MRANATERTTVLDHPLIAEGVGVLRDRETPSALFRQTAERLGEFLAYEICRDAQTRDHAIETPVAPARARRVVTAPLLVPVLRAGLALVPGFTRIFPAASVAHVGLYRDPETLEAVPYYANVPEKLGEQPVYVLDPMLATGGSACAALAHVRERGARETVLVCLIAAPEGVARVRAAFPEARIVTAALDEKLNEHGYIVPGLGDAGDRVFGVPGACPRAS